MDGEYRRNGVWMADLRDAALVSNSGRTVSNERPSQTVRAERERGRQVGWNGCSKSV